MLDSVESISMYTCPKCSVEFTPKRKNQKYCSRPCQRNGARGSRTGENSTMNRRHTDTAIHLRLWTH